MSDTDLIFPTEISYQSSGGPMFNTQIARTRNGIELRNRVWDTPLHKYDATIGPRMEGSVDAVKQFFMAMRGRYSSFRWKDWNDWISDMSNTYNPQPVLFGDTTSSQFYSLRKIYNFGPHQIIRDIKKPRVQGSPAPPDKYDFRLWVDGVEQVFYPFNTWPDVPSAGEFHVNYQTGAIRLGTNFGPGFPMTAIYEFDVRCRFDTDTLEASKLASAVQEIVTIPIIEVRDW